MSRTNVPTLPTLRLLAALLFTACARPPVAAPAPVHPRSAAPPVHVTITFHGFITNDFLIDGQRCAGAAACTLSAGDRGARAKLDTGLHIFEARGPFGIYRYTRNVQVSTATFMIAADNVDPVAPVR